MAFKVKNYNYYTNIFNEDNPYDFSVGGKLDTETLKLMKKYDNPSDDRYGDLKQRSILNRLFSPLMTPLYMTAGAVKGAISPDESVLGNMWEGLKAGNPFGQGNSKGETTFSDVLEESGWKPESFGGKFARGAVGLLADVFLDPSTYLTGGLSTVVKGTGKAGLMATHASEALAKTVSKDVFDNTLTKLADEGASFGVAKSVAERSAKKVEEDITKSGFSMTHDIAEDIVRKRGIAKSEEEIARDADNLVSKFNEVAGLRNPNGGITLSLGNAPFGKKIFGKYAEPSKTFMTPKIVNLSDKLVAPQYAKIRDFIYGSKIGEKLSSVTPLYRASKTNPAEVYNFIKWAEVEKGLAGDAVQVEKAIREKAKMFEGMTPEDSKKLLELMQNKSIWHPIREMVKLSDTKEFQDHVEKLVQTKDEYSKALEDLQARKSAIDNIDYAHNNDLFSAQDELKALRDDYRDKLAKIDMSKITNQKQYNDLLKMHKEELAKLGAEESSAVKNIDDLESAVSGLEKNFQPTRVPYSSEHPLVQMYDDYKNEVAQSQQLKNDIRTAETLNNKANLPNSPLVRTDVEVTPAYQRRIDRQLQLDGKVSFKTERSAKKFEDAFSDWSRVDVTDKEGNKLIEYHPPKVDGKITNLASPEVVDVLPEVFKDRFVESLSKDLFGDPFVISKNVWDENLDNLVEFMKSGMSREEIVNYVEKNKNFYTGKAQAIYSWVAKHMGYDSWENAYHKQVKRIEGKKVLTQEDKDQLAKLEQNRLERLSLLDRLFTSKNPRALMEQKDQEAMFEAYNDLTKADIEKLRNDFNASDYARVDEFKDLRTKLPDAEKSTDFTFNSPDEFVDDFLKYRQNIHRVMDEDGAVVKQIDRGVTKSGEKLTQPVTGRSIRYEQRVVDKKTGKTKITPQTDGAIKLKRKIAMENVEEGKMLLNNVFKTDYDKLSPAQKNFLHILAFNNVQAKKGAEGFKYVSDASDLAISSDKAEQQIIETLQKRMEDQHVELVKSHALEGVDVDVHLPKRDAEGKVIKDEYEDVQGTITRIQTGKSGETLYQIKKADGDVVERVVPGDITKIHKGSVTSETPVESVLRQSDIANEFAERRVELENLINETYGKMKDVVGDSLQAKKELKDTFLPKAEAVKNRIKNLELTAQRLKNVDNAKVETEIAHTTKKIKRIENVLNSDDALDSYVRSQMGEDVAEEVFNKYNPDLGKIVLDPDLPINDKVRDLANLFRDEMIRIGKEEVGVGKLKPEQFEKMMYEYLPHILTADGAKLFVKNKQFEKIEGFGDRFAYGKKSFNPHAMSRTIHVLPDGKGGWIEKPTVEQINEFFERELKTNKVFSENMANIYLARGLKHNELMYDTKYTDELLDKFGSDYSKEVRKGYGIAMNFDRMKESSRAVANLNVEMDISRAVTEHLEQNQIAKQLYQRVAGRLGVPMNPTLREELIFKKAVSKEIGGYIKRYVNNNFPQEVRDKMFDEHFQKFSQGAVDDLTYPILQTDVKRADDLKSTFQGHLDSYTDFIKEKMLKIEKQAYGAQLPQEEVNKIMKMSVPDMRNTINGYIKNADEVDAERFTRLLNKVDALESVKPLQIKEVSDAIIQRTNQARKIAIEKDNHSLLKLYDKFTYLIKLNQTTVLPSFHARNFLSNSFNNWLAIGQDVTNIDLRKQVINAMRKEGNVEGEIGGHTWSELYTEAEKRGLFGKGYYKGDLADGAENVGRIKGLKAKFDPTDSENFIPYKKGSEVGTFIENQDRFLHFVAQVKNGMDYDKALESVNKHLFDYSDVTQFEQNVMRRIFPYYTWLRKNSALQLQMMLDNPGKYQYVAKIMNGIESMNNSEDRINKFFVNDFALDWVQTPFSVTNPEGREEPVLWNPNLPFMDLSRIPNPLHPLDSAKNLFTQMNPMIKTPIEELINRNVFYDQPIVGEKYNRQTKSYEPESELNRLDHILSQLGMYGVASGAVEKDGADLALHALNSTTGLKMLSYDYDKYKGMKIGEMIKSGDWDGEQNPLQKVTGEMVDKVRKAIERKIREKIEEDYLWQRDPEQGRPLPKEFFDE